MTRVAITGATGRMGGELLAAAREREDVTVALATSIEPDAGPVEGYDLADEADFGTLLADREVDVLVDFTVPESSRRYVEVAADAGVAVVVGTTGFDSGGVAVLRKASEDVAVLKAANFARGVQALLQVVGEAATAMEGYDAELIETHHNGKRDAPSGTAKAILDELEGARSGAGGPAGSDNGTAGEDVADDDAGDDAAGDEIPDANSDRIHGREGHAPRTEGEVGVHAVRAGDVTGIHEVLLAGNHEELRLTHRAEDRGVFAEGALDAAAWLDGREPGRYEFADVLVT